VSGLASASGALCGLAIGDALGMPTQLMSRASVSARFGSIRGFEAAASDHPIAAGMPAGSVTDDTEQALLLAELLIEGGGHIAPTTFAARLVEWEDRMRAKGSLDLLGPSTKRAVEAVLAGESVEESGRFGTTNGAAMRVTPVGIVVDSSDVAALVDRVVEASSVSHNTGVAIAAASAVAATVSAGVDGLSLDDAIELGIEAAVLGAERGNWVAAADVAARIRLAIELADRLDVPTSLTRIHQLIGTSLASQESVPAAFGLLSLFPESPWDACLAAASLGGDSDTVAAIAGAMGGAIHGVEVFSQSARDTIASVNGLDLDVVALQLLALR
jgi:ADP-ribosylglycohydrolase